MNRVGIHQDVVLEGFDDIEKQIVSVFAEDWLVTSSKNFTIANSTYKSILIKPSKRIKEMFNLTRELVVAFSPYSTFEPRSIDAIEYLDYQDLRLEEICSIIISKDDNVADKIEDILRKNNEHRIIIPFSYDELLLKKGQGEYIVNKFRRHFYQRDLFDIRDPLKRDLYFFGRNDLIHGLVNRHLTENNSGVFGLRKTGKTSILFSVERVLSKKGAASVYIDCEVLHLKPWNKALYSIIDKLRQKYSLKKSQISNLELYKDEGDVAESFLADIKSIYSSIGKKSILLVFDEVEHISFDTSISAGWRSGEYFLKFWQVIRSTFQNTNGVFSYLICGTNPRCIEKPSIAGVDNPIYVQIPPSYIPQFDVNQTREMINKLGSFMGLEFNDLVCSSLVEDYGGHPFLIRQACSMIHQNIGKERPCKISKVKYDTLKHQFDNSEQGHVYTSQILEVLEKFYPDEFFMLNTLSVGDLETFKGLAEDSPQYTRHLINYGIIEEDEGAFGFRISLVKKFLQEKNKYKKQNQTNDQKQAEISERRNKLEPKLRRIVRNQLKFSLSEVEAKKQVLNKWGSGTSNRRKYSRLTYDELFDPDKHEIYLSDLFNLMKKNWETGFRNLFGVNVAWIQVINATSSCWSKV